MLLGTLLPNWSSMLKMPVTDCDVCSTFITSVNELPGTGSKGSLWFACMLPVDEAVNPDSILEVPHRINDEVVYRWGWALGQGALLMQAVSFAWAYQHVLQVLFLVFTNEKGNQLTWWKKRLRFNNVIQNTALGFADRLIRHYYHMCLARALR